MLAYSPCTPVGNGTRVSPSTIALPKKPKATSKGILSIPPTSITSTPTSPIGASPNSPTQVSNVSKHDSPPPGFEKPNCEVLKPKQKTTADESKGKEKLTFQEPSFATTEIGGSSVKSTNFHGNFMNKELDLSFLQNFYISPALSLHQSGSNFLEGMGSVSPFSLDEPLIPFDKLVLMVNKQKNMSRTTLMSRIWRLLIVLLLSPPLIIPLLLTLICRFLMTLRMYMNVSGSFHNQTHGRLLARRRRRSRTLTALPLIPQLLLRRWLDHSSPAGHGLECLRLGRTSSIPRFSSPCPRDEP